MKVAIIPARGGSKRIPRKNIRSFAGRPMIAYPIATARATGLFDRIIVSTDDDEIAAVAVAHGAEVPFRRPAELCDDYTGTGPVVAHAIDWLENEGAGVSVACCLYATAPFIHGPDLERGLALLLAGDWNYVFSATTFPYTIFRSFRARPDGSLAMFFPEHSGTRSQDLPEALHDAGQFYWGRSDAWRNGTAMFGSSSTVIKLPPWRVQDIDTLEDWTRAEQIMSLISVKE